MPAASTNVAQIGLQTKREHQFRMSPRRWFRMKVRSLEERLIVFGTDPLNTGWGGRIRTSVWWNQNPLPYHLATPQDPDMSESGGP